MAHQLAIRPNADKNDSRKYAYFGAGNPAWHQLGITVKEAQTAEEAIRLGGLDFDVVKQPLFYNGPGNELMTVPGKYATVRTDTGMSLGVVGDTYHVMQNTGLLSALDPIVERGEAVYQTAGVLGQGERVWLMAKLPEQYSIRVGDDDLTEMNVLIYGSHDGSTSNVVCLTPTRVVCNNTLTAALRGTQHKVLVRHTKNAQIALNESHKILGISNNYAKEMEAVYNAMAAKSLTKVKIDKFLLDLYPKDEKNQTLTASEKLRRQILVDFDNGLGSGLSVAKGTVWGLFNAVTHMLDHSKGYEDADARTKSLWFGGSSVTRQKAFDLCLELV